MVNSVLLLVAVVATCGAVAVLFRVNRTVLPSVVMAVIMLVTAVGGPVWEWAKESGGAGLPARVVAPAFEQSLATQAFLWASIGAALAAFCVPRVPAALTGARGAWHPSERIKIVLLTIATGGLAAWIVGLGPAFFNREYYGQFNGNDFLLRAAFPLAMVVGVLVLGMSAEEKSRALRWLIYATSIAWFIALVSTASRTALIFPLVGAILMIRAGLARGRLDILAVMGAASLLALAIFTFAVLLQARGMPHGLLNMPNVISTVVESARSSTDSYLLPLKQLLASIFASVPVAEQSVNYEVGLHVLLGNANILPGTAQPMELERYWPYEWVPLSFAGCWFGATGWAGQVGLFGFMSWVCSYTGYNFERGKYHFLAFLPLMLSLLIAVLSLQYSSRMVWRVFSVAIVLCVIGYLVRERVKPQLIDSVVLTGPAPSVSPSAVRTSR